MDYYRRFPGDYGRDTKHLTLDQHGAYNLLLDHLYSTESSISTVQAALKICGAMSKRDQNAVKFVLANFFERREEGYRHKRVDEELSYAESKRRQASYAGKQSAKARTDVQRTFNGRSTIPDNQTTRQPEEEKTHTENVSIPPLGSAEFKRFFEAYPVQTGRKAALAEWVKQRLDSIASNVMESLVKWKACERWTNPQFIPYAAKWLFDQWKSDPVKGNSNESRQANKEQRRGERSQQAIENALGHRSRLADALRADLPGGNHRGTRPALPASTQRHSPGDSAQSIPESSKKLHVPPDASGGKASSGS